jgi:hypothetical protein
MKKNKCPVCGFFTLGDPHPGSFTMCPVCTWEDDVEDFYENPDLSGGANENISLNQARINYKKFGATEERFIKLTRKPLDNEK